MGRPNFAERHIDGYIEFHLGVRVVKYTRLARIGARAGPPNGKPSHIATAAPFFSGFNDISGSTEYREQVVMFVLDVQRMECIQQVIPSLVWFETLDGRAIERG